MDAELVVVGIDGSPDADRALRWALGHAARVGATVRVVHAWGWINVVGLPGARYATETREQAEARAQELIAAALDRMGDAADGVEIERLVGQVPAAELLIDEAADADLLVVGSRGLGGFRGLMLGSVSHQCVTHAPCPTLVVPTADRAPAGDPG